MSSSLAEASAPDTEARRKARLRGHHRVLAIVGVLLSLMTGVLTTAGTASAQPSQQCSAVCQAPAGFTQQSWNNVLGWAHYWANHNVNWGAVNWHNSTAYYRIDSTPGRGWPSHSNPRSWYSTGSQANNNVRYIFIGGQYRDNSHALQNEEMYRGVAAGNAVGGANTVYEEYDMASFTTPGGQGVNRGAIRMVRNTISGHVYVTFDHYSTFYFVGRF
ncbi:hypothetical protein [Streptomyces sp. SD31]|uniref:hypothetical protein n=1 Tax=Streptomyces sp. SD31 TaxID=3452208 RepID=UPI003F88E471